MCYAEHSNHGYHPVVILFASKDGDSTQCLLAAIDPAPMMTWWPMLYKDKKKPRVGFVPSDGVNVGKKGRS